MAYNTLSFDQRLADNIIHYSLDTLYDANYVFDFLRHLADVAGIELMLTDRHGEKEVVVGDFSHFEIDVVNRPGLKIRVQGRTIAHLYIKEETIDPARAEAIGKLINNTVDILQYIGEQAYGYRESSIYIDELEQTFKSDDARRRNQEKEDPLTGVYNSTYFEQRVSVLDRSEVAPVAVAEFNINDWKVHNDRYGDKGSDRLIKVIAGIIRDASSPDYIIGRTDGDIFVVLMPMPDDGEPERFIADVKKRCISFSDPELVPSVAAGLSYKRNVEESITDKISDAEYLCLEDKLRIKSSDEYKERIRSI